MSELINNSLKRKELLKHLILQMHDGLAPEQVKQQLINLLQKIPYGEVVEVEQELIQSGTLTDAEVLKFCDLHSRALDGQIDLEGAKTVPSGHPVDVFTQENRALESVTGEIRDLLAGPMEGTPMDVAMLQKLRGLFNSLMDVDKHYKRKENLLFPFLEKKGITGPPKVMWGKHDEIRALLKSAIEGLQASQGYDGEESKIMAALLLMPAVEGINDMIMKEEQILLPMTSDVLSDAEWYEIAGQTLEIGYCLYDPPVEWKPDGIIEAETRTEDKEKVQLPSGSFSREELLAILNALPIDITFVDKNDKVKYFSQGKERIFTRSRAILNRDVRMCHPPSSMHVVDQIVEDFRSGRQESAPFWIQMHGKFIHIEYFALRDEQGEYLGTLEVSQDLSAKRELQGEQRILSYAKSEEK